MNKKQVSRYNSFKLSFDHLEENEDIIKNDIPLMAAKAVAKNYLSGIMYHNEIAAAQPGGAREGKEADKERLADIAMIAAGAISSWAATQGNSELHEKLNFTRSQLLYGTDMEITERCGMIRTTALQYKDELAAAGFSAALLDNFITAMDNYGNKSNRPQALKVEQSEARAMVSRLVRDCDKHFKVHLDKLVTAYKLTHLSFYEQYLLKRVIINPPTRHTALAGTITDKLTGKIIEGVIVMAGESHIATQSDEEGGYRLNVAAYGKLSFSFHKEGYKTHIEIVKMTKGKESELAVQMEPVA